jgi:Tol biopolymer transport system component
VSRKPKTRASHGPRRHGTETVAVPEPHPAALLSRHRLVAFAGIAGALLLVAGGYLTVGLLREAPHPGAAAPAAATSPLLTQPHLLYLIPSGGDPTQNRVAASFLDDSGANQIKMDLNCSRVYFAGGHGVCLGQSAAGQGTFFGADFKPKGTFSQPGVPSRTRVSPDGRWGAATVFVTGHSYNSGFSTRTVIYQMANGRGGDLESYVVTSDGHRIESPDFNFWGVTFSPSPSGRFYATLGTGGHTYLLEGDANKRTATVVRDHIECPSLSPDGTRIAYKYRFGNPPQGWRLHVLNLRTMADTELAESRTVDDQAEWLDERTVLYGLPVPGILDSDIWSVPADGTGTPVKFLAHAASPAVVR